MSRVVLRGVVKRRRQAAGLGWLGLLWASGCWGSSCGEAVGGHEATGASRDGGAGSGGTAANFGGTGGFAGKPGWGGSGAFAGQGAGGNGGLMDSGVAGAGPTDAGVGGGAHCKSVLETPRAPVLELSLDSRVSKLIALELGLVFVELTSTPSRSGPCQSVWFWPRGVATPLHITHQCDSLNYTAWGDGLWISRDFYTEYRDLKAPEVDIQLSVGSFWQSAGPHGLLYHSVFEEELRLLSGPEATPVILGALPTEYFGDQVAGTSPLAAWVIHSPGPNQRQLHRFTYAAGGAVTVVPGKKIYSMSRPRAVPSSVIDAVYVTGTDEDSLDTVHLVTAEGGWREVGSEIAHYTLDEYFIYWVDGFSLWQQSHCGGPTALVANLPEEIADLDVHDGVVWVVSDYDEAKIYRVDVPLVEAGL